MPKIDFNKVVGAVQMIGAATPAFKALAGAMMSAFSEPQQETLKRELAAADARADQAHDNAQAAGRGEG